MVKLDWPDIDFPPVNLWVVMSADDFEQLVKDYGIFDIRQRNYYLSEWEPVLKTEQTLSSGTTDP